jgi:hypothetical protein
MTLDAQRFRRSRRTLLVALPLSIALLLVAAAVGSRERGPDGDPGRLVESTWPVPSGVPMPVVSDATGAWRLQDRRPPPAGVDAMAGGLATGDLDGDGDLDLAVAQGSVEVHLWDVDHFAPAHDLGIGGAMAVTIGDVDRDGWADLLIARDAEQDAVLWGGTWIKERAAPPERLELPGAHPSSALIAAELSGDDAIDVVRLGRGDGGDASSVVWVAAVDDRRTFTPTPLGSETGPAMAGEIVDVDDDGLVDVWVTRDIGWATSPDSVYSRRGDPSGPWSDIAAELGADRAIDGMGITIADVDGDRRLDAYLSDLGDNEVLVRDDRGFVPVFDTGAARIRPPGSPASTISSSWASGATDVNLDGRLDLVVANGGFESGRVRNKVAGTDVALVDPPAFLLGIGDGRFTDVWTQLGLGWDSASRGLTIADFDADGDDDYVFLGTDGSLRALRNDIAAASVTVTSAPGCHPAGAVVDVDQGSVTAQWLLAPNAYGGAHSPRFVLGVLPSVADISVTWPDGSTTSLRIPDAAVRSKLVAGCIDAN